MLFKQTNENNCLKVAKAFNTRYFAMRVPRLLKKLPWITLMLVFLIFLIYKYAESQKEVDELRQILIEKHKKGQEFAQFHDQIEADIVINKQFSDIKDTKTLKVLSDKIKELEAFNNINKTLKVLFVSTWKSGGDLIGDVISQHPKSFYHYEPLAWHGIKRFTSETDESAQFVLESLFKCHYGTSLDQYRQDYITNQELLIHNKHLWPHCRKFGWRNWCAREEFLDSICSLFPIQLMKTTRANLEVVSSLLQSLKDLKLILIVRDPRAIMYARSQAIWCQESTFCKDESFLCQDMDKDFDKISQLQKDFPNRVSFVRFEDFASLPKRELLNLAEFLDLPSTEEMERYLDKKVSDNGQLLAHNQDTSSNVWQSQMHFTTIERIQTVCQTAMSKWGYKVFNYQDVHPNRAVLPLDI